MPYLHLLDDAAIFTFDDTGRYCVRDGSDVVVDAKPDADPAVLRLHIFASIMGMICHQRGLLVLHASAVAFGNRAVAFTGPPGAGKSTLAAHCLAAGGRLVADDVLVLSFDEQGGVLAHPGMPNVKLWRDALTSLGRDTDGLRPDWFRAEKFHLPADDVQTSIPLARLFVLGTDCDAGDGEYAPLRGREAAGALIANTYRVEYLDAANRRDAHFRDCIRLASAIDVVWLQARARCRAPAGHGRCDHAGVAAHLRTGACMTVGPDSVIVQEDEPVAAEVDGEVVMLSERAGAYFGLDGIGSEIWRLIAQPRRVSDLCQSLAQRYDVDAET